MAPNPKLASAIDEPPMTPPDVELRPWGSPAQRRQQREAARASGLARLAKHGPAYFSDMGKKGGGRTWQERLAKNKAREAQLRSRSRNNRKGGMGPTRPGISVRALELLGIATSPGRPGGEGGQENSHTPI